LSREIGAVDGVVGVVVVVAVPSSNRIDLEEPAEDGQVLAGPHLDVSDVAGMVIQFRLGALPPFWEPSHPNDMDPVSVVSFGTASSAVNVPI
jgi:hypothetical protein